MATFTKNLIENKVYLLKDTTPSALSTPLKESIVEAKVEKLSVLAKKVKITLLYQSLKPETHWEDVAAVKSLIIDNVDYTPVV